MLNIGIDWSQTHHDACFLNEAGAVVTHLTVPHSRRVFSSWTRPVCSWR
jgi:Transposase